jgi:hypothetical protein
MQNNELTLICVQLEWNGWRTAEVRLSDLQDIHWWQPSGAPRALVHGYIWCAGRTVGAIPHDCERSAGPHRVLVCVLKKHNPPSIYAELVRRAAERRHPAPAVLLPFKHDDSCRPLLEAAVSAGHLGGLRNSRAVAIARRESAASFSVRNPP